MAEIEHLSSEKDEKQAFRKKDRKSTCAKNRDPYNAPPSRRNSESLHKLSKTIREKILKLRVDSERGKRNIRHLELVAISV